MDQRKLIKLGNSSFAIALPKNWIDRAGLKKGDSIFLEENSNGEILLWSKPQKISEDKIRKIKTDKDSSKIRKEIISAYINGFTRIILETPGERRKRNELIEFIESLLGFQIIETGKSEIISKDFFDIQEAKIDNFIRRMDNNLREMFEDLIDSFKKDSMSKHLFDEISKIDRDTTRFHLLISRLFLMGINNPAVMNALKKDSLSFFNEWLLSDNLEHIGDILKEVAGLFLKSKISKEKSGDLLNIIEEIFNCHKMSIECIQTNEKEKAINCAEKGKIILKQCEKLSLGNDISFARLGIKLRELEVAVYQNLKIIIYVREND